MCYRLSQKKGTKAVTGVAPFQKVKLFVPYVLLKGAY